MEPGYTIENAHLKSHLLADAGFEDVDVDVLVQLIGASATPCVLFVFF